ncbi:MULTISPECIES: ATP-dependent DNA helicase RecG [unclassified Streptococcus]|uniref:ATP-dependent DNA helicase RecG n=1 Tax=unclassified Streptococcus TaxID=2608887 RepID=UPI001071BAB8|nr:MULTISPECIES: ATP-dependent DNA helicase RecG [unclassified Streptococcus]MBF0806258.1 ATP-dependent DNA helicase RecG [Streptococcus sp. 19428wA2_WM07]TFU28138.1 ATP-dependent DNA helicase RecG [Streptococcus sp. WM07]
MNLHQPLTVLAGVGPKSAEKWARLGIETLQDLLLYFPFRYEDFKNKSVFDLEDGEKAVLSGVVVRPASVQYYGYKRNRVRFSIQQDQVVIGVNFFNQPYLVDKIQMGATVAVYGKWDQAKNSLTGMKFLTQIDQDLQPVYHVAQGISQASLVKLIRQVIDEGLHHLLEENLPQVLRERYRLLDRVTAVEYMHFPPDLVAYKQALRRIKFEELLYFQLPLQLLKREAGKPGDGEILTYSPDLLAQAKADLPFSLTLAQEKALQDILADMASDRQMSRLLQGDVGSGKTIVAALAMYAAYTAGYQAALMVPTEILAEQHMESLNQLFPDIPMVLLKGSQTGAVRREVLERIASGEAAFVIGTHALIQDGVVYDKLGLIIVDEQHRFGVKQRRALREKGLRPDVLMMTATPIPRTLAITAYGDLDVSIIDQLPAGRKPIITRWVKQEQQEQVYTWLKEELQKKAAQAYVISPLIEESEALDLKNTQDLQAELQSFLGQGIEVGLLHGRMKAVEKDQVMARFKAGELKVLVSTTVIEVGVNVPNASIMIIVDADRFGLSQLHQLRGRVGRGSSQSYAVLIANPKTDTGKSRMKIMTETTDGFRLAEEDLKMRGSGEIFGTRQSGLPEFQVADILEDFSIVEEARKVAQEIVQDPDWRSNPLWQEIVWNLLEESLLD